MIVRMSAETLEALEDFPDHPQMDFEFGDSPVSLLSSFTSDWQVYTRQGIHIGDTFFPMRPIKEATPHELYLRLPSTAKPMAPLRLHANIIGKFMVERELGEKVTDKVRDRTLVAEKQRLERKAIMLDTPPTLSAPNGKKRKTQPPSSMFRNPVKSVASSSAPPLSRVAVPLPAEEISGARMRLIHCLAISPRLSDDVLRLVGGANATASSRQDLLAILHEVRVSTSSRSIIMTWP
jgi:RNA polymerase II elongation factor ELL